MPALTERKILLIQEKKRRYFYGLLMSVLVFTAAALTAEIFTAPAAFAEEQQTSDQKTGAQKTGQQEKCKPPSCYPVESPLGKDVTVYAVIGRAVQLFTGISGSLALLVFIYGGFLWLTSGGDTEKIKKGKDAFKWATIGLVIIFGSYAIITQIFKALGVQ